LGNDIEFGNGMVVNMKSEMRQSMILDRIRQIGNCRLSDIQAILPHVSDRTIRYDLESMIERNLIERVGTGGRSAYYRVAAQLV
jgi:DeoR/GlpR family transcriptional regulator of sugar metabolism